MEVNININSPSSSSAKTVSSNTDVVFDNTSDGGTSIESANDQTIATTSTDDVIDAGGPPSWLIESIAAMSDAPNEDQEQNSEDVDAGGPDSSNR